MLGKLLKYEIKATARLFLPLYLTIIVFAGINRIFLAIPQSNVRALASSNIAMVISMFIYVSLMIGLVLMTLIVLIQRFYKNLLGDEGYLMFTLPVKPWSHILSKLAVSMIWTILSGFVAFCSILFISSNNFSMAEFFKQLLLGYSHIRQYFGASTFLVGLEAVLLALLALASTILTIYAAITLGHLFKRHKLLASFGMYIVLKTISQTLTTILASSTIGHFSFSIGNYNMPDALQINTFLLLSILYTAAITAGYFLLTDYVLKRKLNLE